MSKRVSNSKGKASKNKTQHRHKDLAYRNRMENQRKVENTSLIELLR